MTLQILGLGKCSTCRKAVTWLDDQGISHEFVDYREQPIPPERLVAWAQALGGWPKLVNRASMTWRKLPEDQRDPADDEAWCALIAAYPALVRRPVAWDGDTVSVGFSERKFAARFG